MNEALELRLRGLTLREIAKQMRISVSTAHSYVEDALAEIPRVNAEAVLTQQLERYEMMAAANRAKAANGDRDAGNLWLTSMARIDKLNGVESPIAQDAASEVENQLTNLLGTMADYYARN